MAGTRVHVLGCPRAVREGGAHGVLERKAAALVAYLALEGITPRAKLVGLLWPEASERAARANLRQLLRRLRVTIGADVVVGNTGLELGAGVWVDARSVPPPAADEELLKGCDYDDCEELSAWVTRTRERFTHARAEALRREIDLLERAGSLEAALERADQLRSRDPLSDDASLCVIRLRALLGDQSGALRAFRECQELFRAELGISPSDEISRLAEEIQRRSPASFSAGRPAATRRVMFPLSVERPPCLAGRTAAWSALEESFESRRTIFMAGDAGVGKSRLASDFSASKGRWLHLQAHPGDHRVPYSTHARSARALLAANPGASYPRWIRRELARLVPDMAGGGQPPPAASDQGRLTFLSAVAQFFWRAAHGFAAIVLDDAHHIDPQSAELSLFIHAHRPSTRDRPVFINSFQPRALEQPIWSWVRELVEKDMGSLVELGPLPEPEVRNMLASMDVQGLELVAGEMTRYTGGYPLFIVETAKRLIESGDFDGAFLAALRPPGRIRPIIEQQLAGLSPDALALARLAALARADIDLPWMGRALALTVPRLWDAWRELEAAQVIRDGRVAFGLVAETILETIPPATRSALSALAPPGP